VPVNIAEGYGRESLDAHAHHLKVAQESLKEFKTHIDLAHRVGLITINTPEPYMKHTDEIEQMLRALIRSVERQDVGQLPPIRKASTT
jgi:four helix bundle protein